MSADIGVQDCFLDRLSLDQLTALREQLSQCIKFATPNRRNGKGRRSRNRRHQLTTQAAAVQRHILQREAKIDATTKSAMPDHNTELDNQQQPTLIPFMPLLNV